MTTLQVNKAMQIAQDMTVSLESIDDSPLIGCGTSGFLPVYVTLTAVAKFLRWQTIMFNGEVDMQELNNLRWILKHRIQVVGN